MRTSYLFICSLLVLAIFSCTSNVDELIVEQGQVKPRCEVLPHDRMSLIIDEEYSYSNYPGYRDIVLKGYTPEYIINGGFWQLQFNDNGTWRFVEDGADYDWGTYMGDDHVTFEIPKSRYPYGDIEFRARRIGGFMYRQEPNPIYQYVTDWSPVCTAHNNYMKEAGGLITNSYITVVIDFIFRSNDYNAKRIGKDTYRLGFNALLEGKSSMKIPGPAEHTSTHHTYRYVYTVDKGDYSSNDDFNFHLKNLSPYEMYWSDVFLSAKAHEIQNVIFETVQVNVGEHDKDDYKYDELGFE